MGTRQRRAGTLWSLAAGLVPMVVATAVASAAEPPGGPSTPAPSVSAPSTTPGSASAPAGDVEQIENPTVFTLWLDPENYPRVDRAVNLMNARTTRRRALNFVIDHRAFEPFQKRAFDDFLGFDAGALKIGLAFRYGIFDDLDVGVARLSNGADIYDTYQFDAKYWFVRAERFYVDAAVRAGGSWYFVPQGPDSGGGFAQLILSRSLRERAWFATGVAYHSNASNEGRFDNSAHRRGGRSWALAVPAVLELRLQPFLAWDVEAAFNVAGYGSKYPVFSSAIKIITYRHTFAFIFSNSQYIYADGMVANTDRGFHNVIVGFTITREFDL